MNINIFDKAMDKRKRSFFPKQSGFTLVELLVVIIVLASVGSTLGGILVSALRGSNKTNVLSDVRENGSVVLTQMSKTVQLAKTFEGVSTNRTSFTNNCTVPTVAAGTPTPTQVRYQAVKITTFENKTYTYECTPASSGQETISVIVVSICDSEICSLTDSLIDTTAVALVPNSCYFTCSQKTRYDSPTIGINFALTQYTPSGTLVLPEFSSPATLFQTSVTIRNLNK